FHKPNLRKIPPYRLCNSSFRRVKEKRKSTLSGLSSARLLWIWNPESYNTFLQKNDVKLLTQDQICFRTP
ncbi:hypothetical protein NPIL_140341, partial [Nephila pilipes]